MLNVCIECGMYRADKEVDVENGTITCPECDHVHPFNFMPLMIVSGPSAAGKSTVCHALTGVFKEAVLLDGDLLWRSEFNSPENSYREFYETWLRMAKNIGQSGRPVVLFNAGAIPDNVIECVEARYFSGLHFLALVCKGEELARRLKARPEWRGSGQDPFVTEQLRFNQWLIDNGQTDGRNMALIDSSADDLAGTLQKVSDWMQACISQ